jgi:hypothetical protein
MDGPNLVELGGHGVASNRDNPWSDIDLSFAIRPDEPDQDHRREAVRMDAHRPETEPAR